MTSLVPGSTRDKKEYAYYSKLYWTAPVAAIVIFIILHICSTEFARDIFVRLTSMHYLFHLGESFSYICNTLKYVIPVFVLLYFVIGGYAGHARLNREAVDHSVAQDAAKNFTIGSSMAGGIYAGAFTLDGINYALIASPVERGEQGFPWVQEYIFHSKKIKTPTPNHGWDGLANTAGMAVGKNSMAKRVDLWVINDYNDWYIPSINELEMCFKNLKAPCLAHNRDETDSSSVSNQPSAIRSLDENIDWRFGNAPYWSSTSRHERDAWYVDFADGAVSTMSKIEAAYFRLVRKEPI